MHLECGKMKTYPLMVGYYKQGVTLACVVLTELKTKHFPQMLYLPSYSIIQDCVRDSSMFLREKMLRINGLMQRFLPLPDAFLRLIGPFSCRRGGVMTSNQKSLIRVMSRLFIWSMVVIGNILKHLLVTVGNISHNRGDRNGIHWHYALWASWSKRKVCYMLKGNVLRMGWIYSLAAIMCWESSGNLGCSSELSPRDIKPTCNDIKVIVTDAAFYVSNYRLWKYCVKNSVLIKWVCA